MHCAGWNKESCPRIRGPRAPRAMAVLFLGMLVACGSRSSSQTPIPQEPIPECVEYERTFARCNGVDAGILAQPAAIPSTRADRDRLRTLCAVNLDRLKQACR
jgi:hypothetical protein